MFLLKNITDSKVGKSKDFMILKGFVLEDENSEEKQKGKMKEIFYKIKFNNSEDCQKIHKFVQENFK